MKSSFCIDLQRFMLIPTKFPLTLYYGYKKTLREGESIMLVDRWPNWHRKNNGVTKIVFDKSFAQARPTSCEKWFWEFYNLT